MDLSARNSLQKISPSRFSEHAANQHNSELFDGISVSSASDRRDDRGDGKINKHIENKSTPILFKGLTQTSILGSYGKYKASPEINTSQQQQNFLGTLSLPTPQLSCNTEPSRERDNGIEGGKYTGEPLTVVKHEEDAGYGVYGMSRQNCLYNSIYNNENTTKSFTKYHKKGSAEVHNFSKAMIASPFQDIIAKNVSESLERSIPSMSFNDVARNVSVAVKSSEQYIGFQHYEKHCISASRSMSSVNSLSIPTYGPKLMDTTFQSKLTIDTNLINPYKPFSSNIEKADSLNVANDNSQYSMSEKTEDSREQNISSVSNSDEETSDNEMKDNSNEKEVFSSHENLSNMTMNESDEDEPDKYKVQGEKLYKCPHCKRSFVKKGNLDNHIKMHQNYEMHNCEVCNQYFTVVDDLAKHETIHPDKKLHMCLICEKYFVNSCFMKKHHMSLHNPELEIEENSMMKCRNCGKYCDNVDDLKYHEKMCVHSKYISSNNTKDTLPVNSKTKEVAEIHSKNLPIFPERNIEKILNHSDEEYVNTHSKNPSVFLEQGVQAMDHIENENNIDSLIDKTKINDEPLDTNTDNKAGNQLSGYKNDFTESMEYDEYDSQTSHVKLHEVMVNEDKKYYCGYCGECLCEITDVKQHEKVHFEYVDFTGGHCGVCCEYFHQIESLREHEKSHDDQLKPYKCQFCSKSYKHEDLLKVHEKVHTDYKPFKCKFCFKGFTDKSHMDRHLRTHTGERPYICESCHKDFADNSDLQRHQRIHTGEKPYKCEYCGKHFTSNSNLTRHIRIHIPQKPYKCEYCGRCFYEEEELKLHERTHFGEKPYKCTYCDVSFKRPGPLVFHERSHTGEKPHLCKFCDKGFSRKANMLKHEKIHTGEKPHECPICNKCFGQSSTLKEHLRIHTGEKPFACKFCDKRFTDKCHVVRHERTHTGEKPYKCEVCTKAFADSNTLQRHQRVHTGERPYLCDFCDKKFIAASNLGRHLKVHRRRFERERLKQAQNELALSGYQNNSSDSSVKELSDSVLENVKSLEDNMNDEDHSIEKFKEKLLNQSQNPLLENSSINSVHSLKGVNLYDKVNSLKEFEEKVIDQSQNIVSQCSSQNNSVVSPEGVNVYDKIKCLEEFKKEVLKQPQNSMLQSRTQNSISSLVGVDELSHSARLDDI